ncbi:Probable manganese-dependent inorganic pyrophosphatase [Mycoplasmopsis meleagridis]|nr:DHH family phosphoesterase [Mycoplasmopsis meleagridis]VEU77448.1 Probable manganese-dependent inorganic pyrophosphatase [Mycoplasmopsis meleagridis]
MKNIKFNIKKKKFIINIALLTIFIILFVVFLSLYVIQISQNHPYYYHIIFVLLFIITLGLVSFMAIETISNFIYYNRIGQESFNSSLDEVNKHNLVGIIIYSVDNKIIWTSQFINDVFGNKWLGKKISAFFNHLKVADFNKKSFEFRHDNNFYSVEFWYLKNSLVIRDITIEKNLMNLYDKRTVVIGEVEIDNYQLYQSLLSDDQMFNLNTLVISVLDKLATDYNLVYRQYNPNGKFLIITDKESIEKMQRNNFGFFELTYTLDRKTDRKFTISLSAGFASGINLLSEKMQKAKDALSLAQSRGGNQVAIINNNLNAFYYGSSNEITPSTDRTKLTNIIKVLDETLKQKTVKKAIIYGHANADLDAIGSSLGLVALVRHYGKEAYICTSSQDSTTKKILNQYYPNSDIFIKPKQADKLKKEKDTLIFLTDVSSVYRTDNKSAIEGVLKENIFIFDHHRQATSTDFAPKINKIIDPSVSSASEIVCEILRMHPEDIIIDWKIAQMLLNGIYLDTLQFQKNVTAKTFEAASWLETKGANSTNSNQALKIDSEAKKIVDELLENLQEIKPGYFLAYKDILASDDIISVTAEEILRISDRKASFVIARNEKGDSYKMSARGIGVNVQLIAEAVGGGGHFSTAAAVSKENLDVFIDNLKQAIISSNNP